MASFKGDDGVSGSPGVAGETGRPGAKGECKHRATQTKDKPLKAVHLSNLFINECIH